MVSILKKTFPAQSIIFYSHAALHSFCLQKQDCLPGTNHNLNRNNFLDFKTNVTPAYPSAELSLSCYWNHNKNILQTQFLSVHLLQVANSVTLPGLCFELLKQTEQYLNCVLFRKIYHQSHTVKNCLLMQDPWWVRGRTTFPCVGRLLHVMKRE